MSFYEHHGHEKSQRPLPDGYGDLREAAPAGGAADAPEPEAAAPAAVPQVHPEGARGWPAARPFFREPRSRSPSGGRFGFAQGIGCREDRHRRGRYLSRASSSRSRSSSSSRSRSRRRRRKPVSYTHLTLPTKA